MAALPPPRLFAAWRVEAIRHPDLPLPYRHLAWQMSNHIDANTTLQRTQHGLLQRLLGWPLAPPGGFVQPGHSLSQEDASRDRPGSAPLGPPQLRWRRDALHPPEVFRDHLAGNTCAHIPDGGLRCISWNARGSLALLLPRNAPFTPNSVKCRWISYSYSQEPLARRCAYHSSSHLPRA